jgi:hypothetical protein
VFARNLRALEAGLADLRPVQARFSVYSPSSRARFERELVEVRDADRHIPVEGFFDGPLGSVALRIEGELFPMQATSPSLRVIPGPGTAFSGMLLAGGLAPGRYPYQLLVTSEGNACLRATEFVQVDIQDETVELDPDAWFSPEDQGTLTALDGRLLLRGTGHFGVVLPRGPDQTLFRFEARVHCDSGAFSFGIKFLESSESEITNVYQAYQNKKETSSPVCRVSALAPEHARFVMPYVYVQEPAARTTVERPRLQTTGRRAP